jgi:hypothetical protein
VKHKGIDAIKEAGLKLRDLENNKGTQAALEGIGISSREMIEGLNSGALTIFDVQQKASKALQNTELKAGQVQAGIAEIFGAAGEDAGLAFIQSIGDMNTNLDDLVDKNADFNSQQLSMLEIQEQLSVALQGVVEAISPVFNEILSLFSTVLLPIFTELSKSNLLIRIQLVNLHDLIRLLT